jgi:enterochelin esterase-like enzyme
MMGPNSPDTMIVLLGCGVAAAAATAWLWNRVRSWWGWFDRVVAVLLSVACALGAAGIAVNQQLNLYTSWAQVLGERVAGQGRPETVSQGVGGSRVVRFTITGRSSGISLAAYAYLPAGYDSPAGARTRYPVVEAVDGFPGSPNTWLVSLRAGQYLDNEIAQRRMAPTVVIFPTQVLDPTRDSECVDAAGGAQFDTYLSTDLRQAVSEQFRVRDDRAGWSIIGTSTGGFCAINLALRHPGLYAAAASLSGYFTALTDGTTGDLYRGDALLRDENSPQWRVGHLPVPPTPMYLGVARDDRSGFQAVQDFAAAAKPPVSLTTVIVPQGGHTGAVWRTLLPSAFDWLSGQLAAPQVSAVSGPVIPVPTHGPVVQRITPCPLAAPPPAKAGTKPGAKPAPPAPACLPKR